MKENKKGNLRVSSPELNRLQIEDSTFSSVILKHFVKPPTSNSSLGLSCLINCKSSSVDIFDTPGNRIFTASVVNFIAILDFALIAYGVLGIRRRIERDFQSSPSRCDFRWKEMCQLWRVLFVLFIYSSGTITEQGFCKEKGCSEERERATLAKSQSERETVRSSGMEWRSHGRDNNDLVSQLTRNKILKTQRVQEAMRKVDRGNYCDFSPYLDSPQSIGYGVTISAPHMHAHALEMLKEHLFEGAKALDVGSGIAEICR